VHAVVARVGVLTLAGKIEAVTVAAAVVRANHGKAVGALVPFVANARPVVAVSVQGAGGWAGPHRTVHTDETRVAVALEVILFRTFGPKRATAFAVV
jgi:hypothetical protein